MYFIGSTDYSQLDLEPFFEKAARILEDNLVENPSHFRGSLKSAVTIEMMKSTLDESMLFLDKLGKGERPEYPYSNPLPQNTYYSVEVHDDHVIITDELHPIALPMSKIPLGLYVHLLKEFEKYFRSLVWAG
jgi:hypothetical protein